jgi:hypothetical protein
MLFAGILGRSVVAAQLLVVDGSLSALLTQLKQARR